jgi:hypothetical protein
MSGLAHNRLRPASVLVALGAVLLLAAILAPAGHAASVVAPNGQISGCIAKKGKTKGTLRVVPPKARCRRGEKRLSFAAQGQSGQTGQAGQGGSTGSQGSSGQTDSTLETRVTQLETQNTQLTNQVAGLLGQVGSLQGVLSGLTHNDLLGAVTGVGQLQGVLSGLSNTDLTGAVTNALKLNGISATNLTDAIGAVPDVTALCTTMTASVTQLNSLRSVLSGLSLTGLIPIGLLLNVPSLPSTLSPFSC